MSKDDAIRTITSSEDPEMLLEIAATWSAREIRNAIKTNSELISDPDTSPDDLEGARFMNRLIEVATPQFRRVVDKNYDEIAEVVEQLK